MAFLGISKAFGHVPAAKYFEAYFSVGNLFLNIFFFGGGGEG